MPNSGWKEQIITDDPGSEQDEVQSVIEEEEEIERGSMEHLKYQVKSSIVNLVKNGVSSREQIVDTLDESEDLVDEALDELKSEGVLEVVSK